MRTTCVIIGAGHNGLAMSRRLTERSIDHVVLERGEVANSWRTERWDSLRLLTPNWETRLPGLQYDGDEADGYMTAPDVARFIDRYADAIGAPVQSGTTVTRVTTGPDGYEVATDHGEWTCATVVIASGAASVANIPPAVEGLPACTRSISPLAYKCPDSVDDGGVLIVGASASGIQLADELARAGLAVTIAVGEHVRMPRTYRGRDVFWWLEAAGVLDDRHDEVEDLVRARHVPSPQLLGSAARRTIDLNAITDLGVEVVGRLGTMRDGMALFSGGLANTCRLADLKMNRLLDRFDEWACAMAPERVDDAHRFEPTRVPDEPPLQIDLRRRGIATVIWATGYRPDHSWLDLPVLDRKGRIGHDGGIVLDAPGLYVLGGNLLRTRRSSYIAGAVEDTDAIADHLHRYLGCRERAPITPRP